MLAGEICYSSSMTIDAHPRQASLSAEELAAIHAWWRAANYLSVGQICLLDNPLLHEPLRSEHVKPRLFGHWGTTPGLNFIYARDPGARAEHDLHHGTRPWGSRPGGRRVPGRHVQRALSAHRPR